MKKGQTLIAIFIIMLIALSVGVAVSSRFTASLHIFSRTDDSSKALAAAEAGLERTLALPMDTLKDYVDHGSCGTNCIWQVTDTTGQIIRANVTLSYEGNSSTEAYKLNLSQDANSELSLAGYTSGKTLSVCWNSGASVYANYISQSGSSIKSKGYEYNAISSTHTENGFSPSSAMNGYQSCFNITATDTPLVLRLKSYYEDTQVFLVPYSGGSVPMQGILLKSVGQAGDSRRTVSALKTFPHTPVIFDYVLYQKSPTDPLSNRTY